MKQYVTSICIFTSSLILLLAICVLSCSAKMTGYLLEKRDSTVVARGVEGLDLAKRAIETDMKEKVEEASVEAFNSLTSTIYEAGVNITEEEANSLYKGTVLQILKAKYGMLGGTEDDANYNLIKSLEDKLPGLSTGELKLVENSVPTLERDGNRINLGNVDVAFCYGNSYNNSIKFDVFAYLSDISLYDENPELFKYAIVADKGVYITGKTSTIIGNIFAGTHSPTELRKAEALYGESGTYGGVNIMSTQVAIDADRIVTDGAINMKGAFVVFGSENRPVEIIAADVMETDNIANKNMYALFGKVKNQDISLDRDMVNEAMQYFGSIEYYYDSNNDKTYIGRYRKIISSTDITIDSDVTGVVMTPGNVIINEGVNVEGLILSGDRVYVQGNNNIVASVEVLREILAEELYANMHIEDESDTLEEQARNKLHVDMKDYLGGIVYRGINK
ncbi:MAG: hypothetical protein Q4D29_04330 [Lachnospiraceae bacterium]|nr:hypothetical protein [Lachnospiraceae bacterium]